MKPWMWPVAVVATVIVAITATYLITRSSRDAFWRLHVDRSTAGTVERIRGDSTLIRGLRVRLDVANAELESRSVTHAAIESELKSTIVWYQAVMDSMLAAADAGMVPVPTAVLDTVTAAGDTLHVEYVFPPVNEFRNIEFRSRHVEPLIIERIEYVKVPEIVVEDPGVLPYVYGALIGGAVMATVVAVAR